MKYVDLEQLSPEIQAAATEAKDWAEKSVTPSGGRVGCSFILENGMLCCGATVGHSRIVGSTCAERMAIDKLYLSRQKAKTCILIGKLVRGEWTEESICTPCGKCLEMMWEYLMYYDMDDIEIYCLSWNKSRILKTTLTELYPRAEAVRRVFD